MGWGCLFFNLEIAVKPRSIFHDWRLLPQKGSCGHCNIKSHVIQYTKDVLKYIAWDKIIMKLTVKWTSMSMFCCWTKNNT